MQELLDKCHPLGMFDSISTLAVASNMRELYRLVLVDTPLAPYFAESLTSGLCRLFQFRKTVGALEKLSSETPGDSKNAFWC